LISLRLETAALLNTERQSFKVLTFDKHPNLLCIVRNPEKLTGSQPSDKSSYLCFFNLKDQPCTINKTEVVLKSGQALDVGVWSLVLHTDEARFSGKTSTTSDPKSMIELATNSNELRFGGAGAAIVKVAP